MKFEKAFCPSCGAPIIFPDGKDTCFCSHCGHQIFLTDEQLKLKLKYKDRHERREFLKEVGFGVYLIIMFIIMFLMLALS